MLADLIERRKVVRTGGREFLCRPPSLATVSLFLQVFGARIIALVAQAHAGAIPPEKRTAEELLPLFLGPRLAEVLETCVTMRGPGDFLKVAQDPDLQLRLARTVLGLTNPEKIVELLRLDEYLTQERDDRETDQVITGAELVVARVAQAFGCSPSAVMEWPYLAFAAARELLFPEDEARAEDVTPGGLPGFGNYTREG